MTLFSLRTRLFGEFGKCGARLMRVLNSFEDMSCYVQCTLCFARDSESPVRTFVERTFDSSTWEEREDQNFAWDPVAWDPVFHPINSEKTCGEMTLTGKNFSRIAPRPSSSSRSTSTPAWALELRLATPQHYSLTLIWFTSSRLYSYKLQVIMFFLY
jgi:hypothetical protein